MDQTICLLFFLVSSPMCWDERLFDGCIHPWHIKLVVFVTEHDRNVAFHNAQIISARSPTRRLSSAASHPFSVGFFSVRQRQEGAIKSSGSNNLDRRVSEMLKRMPFMVGQEKVFLTFFHLFQLFFSVFVSVFLLFSANERSELERHIGCRGFVVRLPLVWSGLRKSRIILFTIITLGARCGHCLHSCAIFGVPCGCVCLHAPLSRRWVRALM